MRLTEKDRQFLATLRELMARQDDMFVDLVSSRPSYMVLRGNYGGRIHQAFDMTRQGVRWRFQRLFNEVYVNAFSTILAIEQTFGSSLRGHAIRISRECHALRQAREMSPGEMRRLRRSRDPKRTQRAQPEKPSEPPETA